ncbi:MAG: LuxR C-terminal-related transcriptional regulator [Bacteroidota bacterium]|nr:LuxR C-terminal-related transcriptional regulator [Bacteroidota bacterium]
MNEFDSLWSLGVSNTRVDTALSKKCIDALNEKKRLNYVEKAKLNYLKSKVHAQNLKNISAYTVLQTQNELFDPDSLLKEGISFIDHGYASKGLSIIYDYMNDNKTEIPDTLRDYLNIKIAEGLRINLEYKKAEDILKNLIDDPQISYYNKAYAYNRLAAIYDVIPYLNFQERIDSVKKYSELSMEISKKHNFLYLLAISQNELGSLYKLSSLNLELSEEYCTKAFDNFIKIGAYRNAINTSIILSNLYILRGTPEKAPELLYRVLDLVDIIGNEDIYMRVYLQLAKSHQYLNNYYEAYEFLSVGRLLQKTLFESIRDEEINEMSAKYNLALKEAEISKRQHEINIQKKDIQYITIILIITIIILIIGTLYFILKRKNLRQRHELETLEKEKFKILFQNKTKELEYKNKELASSLAHNIDKNNVLRLLRNEVGKKKDHNELIDMINSNIDTTQNWKRVFLNFQNLYPDFTPKLSLKHSDLTTNETKICALLILKLSTREIAEILSVSESAINKNRQRLRRKLNLTKEADLYEYLQTFI